MKDDPTNANDLLNDDPESRCIVSDCPAMLQSWHDRYVEVVEEKIESAFKERKNTDAEILRYVKIGAQNRLMSVVSIGISGVALLISLAVFVQLIQMIQHHA